MTTLADVARAEQAATKATPLPSDVDVLLRQLVDAVSKVFTTKPDCVAAAVALPQPHQEQR